MRHSRTIQDREETAPAADEFSPLEVRASARADKMIKENISISRHGGNNAEEEGREAVRRENGGGIERGKENKKRVEG